MAEIPSPVANPQVDGTSMSSSAERTQGRDRIVPTPAIVELAAKFVTPAVLALAGTFYTAGYSYRGFVLRYEGLSPSIAEVGLQETMVQGLVPCTFLFLITALPVALVAIALRGFFRRLSGSVTRPLEVVIVVASALIYGFCAGLLVARLEVKSMNNAIDGGCRSKCYRYETARGAIYGFMISNGKDHVVVKGTSGTFILKPDEIKRVVGGSENAKSALVLGPFF